MLLAIAAGLLAIVALGIKLAVLAVTVYVTFNILLNIIGGLFEALGNPDQIAIVPTDEIFGTASNEQERNQLLTAINDLVDDKVPVDRIKRGDATLAIPRNGGTITSEDLEKAQVVDARQGTDRDCKRVRIFEAA